MRFVTFAGQGGRPTPGVVVGSDVADLSHPGCHALVSGEPPSLLAIHAFPQSFLHNGAATSLGQAMNNVTHRSAGTSGVDTLSNAADRDKLVKFLQSIDASTVPFQN